VTVVNLLQPEKYRAGSDDGVPAAEAR
jgi:hypothetical protein